jgi:predicted NUDIX family NTP pyrophosphohydrolase
MLYRVRGGELQVLIGHPGGPLWASRDAGSWSIPKGLLEPGEDVFAGAVREFIEETGFELPETPPIALDSVVQASGKRVTAWAVEGDADTALLTSNPVEMGWPRGSGRRITFPEIDRVIWAGIDEAVLRLNPAQIELVWRLAEKLGFEISP